MAKRSRKVQIEESAVEAEVQPVVDELEPEAPEVAPEPEPEPAPVPAPAPRKRLLNARPGPVIAGPLTFGPGDCLEVTDAQLADPRIQRALAVGLLVKV